MARTIANPCVSVRDIDTCLRSFLAADGSNDLGKLFDLPGVKVTWSWGAAPNVKIMSNSIALVDALLALHPNTKIASSKLNAALAALVGDVIPIPAAARDDPRPPSMRKSDYVDSLDSKIRYIMNWFKVCASDPSAFQKVAMKLSSSEYQRILQSLAKVSLGGDKEESDSQSQVKVEPGTTTTSQVKVEPGTSTKKISCGVPPIPLSWESPIRVEEPVHPSKTVKQTLDSTTISCQTKDAKK